MRANSGLAVTIERTGTQVACAVASVVNLLDLLLAVVERFGGPRVLASRSSEAAREVDLRAVDDVARGPGHSRRAR